MTVEGIINLNKPPGKTSFQVVSFIRRATGVRRVGHSGTLDPDATGVLPILLARATRLASYIVDLSKVYRCEILLGQATTTYDAMGAVTHVGDTSTVTQERLEEAINTFRGVIEQVPPMFSAVKQNGRPLYRLARNGVEIDRDPRMVTVYRADLIQWRNPVAILEIECGKGTYIRSLAHDLGQYLGCGAHVRKLTRLRCGPFRIEDSVSIEVLEAGFRCGGWEQFVWPLDIAISHLSPVSVDPEVAEAIGHGKPVSLLHQNIAGDGEERRAYFDDRFLAIIRFDEQTGLWHPKKVFC